MSLQKLLSGHLLPHTFRPPTKTPTVGLPVTQPGRACIRLLPSSISALVRTNERRLSSGSRPRLRRNAGRTLYLFFSHGLGILTLNHSSHLPLKPIRKRARESPTINEPMADCEQLTSTARSYPTDLNRRRR